MSEKNKTVFVGLSGGVDSSVAALRLLKQGYNVVGVFIKVWHPDWLKCNWEAERLDAMRVAARLKIKFLTCDAEQAYKDGVADYFIREYSAGRTPNPDVMCNKHVKFGTFLKFAIDQGADYIATGHYARRTEVTNGEGVKKFQLNRGLDNDKDQSYFLWTLTQEQLARTLFPIGDTEKSQVRKEAKKAGLLTASKKDSQGICFLGHIDIAQFLSHYIDLEPGEVLDMTGKIIGHHNGAMIYTTGQRHGFTITTKDEQRQPYYVIDRDLTKNTITVGNILPTLNESDVLKVIEVNLIEEDLGIPSEIEVQTRYRQKPNLFSVTKEDKDLILRPKSEIDSVSSGQSCVFYSGSQCLGGGIIK